MAEQTTTTTDAFTPNRVLTEWLDKHYDTPQCGNCGPEALAWDTHSLQTPGQQQPTVQV